MLRLYKEYKRGLITKREFSRELFFELFEVLYPEILWDNNSWVVVQYENIVEICLYPILKWGNS